MLRKSALVALFLVVAFAGMALAAPVLDDHFTSLDTKVWRIYSNSESATVATNESLLTIATVDTGWKQKGIVLNAPIDLTGKTTTFIVDYKQAGFDQQCPALFNKADIEGEDNWNYAGFRVTVGPTSANMESTPPFGSESSGSIEMTSDENGLVDLEAPYTYTWILKNTAGSVYSCDVLVGGALKWQGTVDVGSFDAKNAYFYFYVSNNTLEGPVIVDRMQVTQ